MAQIHHLENGIPVVMQAMPASPSVTIGYYVLAGTVDEADYPKGISHMIEHMLFKGTKNRTAQQLAREIDLLGGEINAYTSKECTGIYAKVLPEDLQIPIAIIGDMLMNGLYDPEELEKEKMVISEEIHSYEDTPEEFNYDLLSEVMYRETPLVFPILGNESSMKSITREDILSYMDRYYTADRMAIAIAGTFDVTRVLEGLNATVGKIVRKSDQPGRAQGAFSLKAGTAHRQRSFEQTHLDFAFWGPSANDPLYYAMHLVNLVIGGTMSSRLFQSVREELGLVYSIYSGLSSYERTGNMTISLSLSEKNVRKATDAVVRELVRLREEGISAEEFAGAKHHLKGSLVLSTETSDAYMGLMAKDLLFGRSVRDIGQVISEIESITPEQVDQALSRIFEEEKALSAVGKIDKKTIMELYGIMINNLEGEHDKS